MPDHPDDRSPGRSGPAARDARRRFHRRLLLVAVAPVVGWLVMAGAVSAVTRSWDDRPRGLAFGLGSMVVLGGAAALTYRRLSRPAGDLVDAAERVAAGDHGVDLEVRGPRELRLVIEAFNDMAARLAANERQRRRFLADITHELRNPLAVLQSRIEAQLDGIHPRDDRHLASLLEETRRLGRLVDDLHTLALAETGRLVLRREAVAFGDLVDEAVGRHQALAEQREVSLRAALAPALPKVRADPARVGQVLDNLLANAIRHSLPGGEVVVEAAPVAGPGTGDAPMVRCRVTDAGPGFREDRLGRLFERFEPAGDSRGSGLGLSIARDLIRAHGGTIEAGNDPTTGGASVTFTLPV